MGFNHGPVRASVPYHMHLLILGTKVHLPSIEKVIIVCHIMLRNGGLVATHYLFHVVSPVALLVLGVILAYTFLLFQFD